MAKVRHYIYTYNILAPARAFVNGFILINKYLSHSQKYLGFGLVFLGNIWYNIEWNITRSAGVFRYGYEFSETAPCQQRERRIYMAKTEKKTQKSSSGIHRAMPIILLALAVFTGICFITKDDTGMLGYAISGALLGLFSVGAYFIPALLAVHALFYSSDIKEKRLVSRIIFSFLTIIGISIMTHAITSWGTEPSELLFDPVQFFKDGAHSIGGGFIGGIFAFLLMNLLGHIGVIILSVALIAIYLVYFFSKGSTLKEVGRVIIYGVLTFLAIIEKGIKKLVGFFKRSGGKKKAKQETASTMSLADDDFFDVDNGISRLEIRELGIVESRSPEAIEANPTLHERVYHSGNDGIEEDEETVSSSHSSDIFVYEEYEEEDTKIDSRVSAEEERGSDPDSADSVFTSSFDPYDLAMAERLASKPSSRTVGTAERKASPTVTESLDDITPEQARRIRLEEEFERRKRAIIEEQRAREEARREVEAREVKKSVEFRVEGSEEHTPIRPSTEEESVTLTIEKFDCEGTARAGEGTCSTVYEPAITRDEGSDSEGNGLLFEFDNTDSITVERTRIGSEPTGYTGGYIEEDAETVFEEDDDELAELDEGTAPEFDEDDSPREDEEIPPAERNPFITEARGMFDFFSRDESAEPIRDTGTEAFFSEQAEKSNANDDFYNTEPDNADKPETVGVFEEDIIPEAEDDEDDDPPFEFIGNDGSVRPIVEVKEPIKEPIKEEKPKKKGPDYSKYKLPPIDLLGLDETHDEDEISVEIQENTRILVETLASFNVTASIKGVDRGPRITRYEVVPARGVKVQQVTNLFNDINLALASEGVRMQAPIPGKSAIGFEIPNKHPRTVRIRELLECDEFRGSRSPTYVTIGKDVAGNPIFGDIAKFPHALVAGATGMGKSVCINSIIVSMLYKARPDEVRFILIDPKKVEFKVYSGIPHLLVPVVTEAKQAAGALMWAVDEMERRYDLIEKFNLRNIEAYNEKVRNDPSLGSPLSKIVIIIDELNDLMMQVRDPAEDLIMRIAQKARAAGIHLIIGTQRPDVKVITGTIKANIGTRISCKVTSVVDSRTILEKAGAEVLLNKGDMLFKPTDRTDPVRVQGCFVSDGEVEAIVEFVKQFATGEQYDEEVIAEINKAAAKCGKEKRGADVDDEGGEECGFYSDQQFLDAVELAIRSGKVSTSLLQRKLQIGFGKAARFIDAMEDIGVVSEPNGQKPRDVLITMDEWREKLSRVDY